MISHLQWRRLSRSTSSFDGGNLWRMGVRTHSLFIRLSPAQGWFLCPKDCSFPQNSGRGSHPNQEQVSSSLNFTWILEDWLFFDWLNWGGKVACMTWVFPARWLDVHWHVSWSPRCPWQVQRGNKSWSYVPIWSFPCFLLHSSVSSGSTGLLCFLRAFTEWIIRPTCLPLRMTLGKSWVRNLMYFALSSPIPKTVF